MAIKNYSTVIKTMQTVGEIMQLLSSMGATHINMKYENTQPVAIMFSIVLPLTEYPLNFALPCNVFGVRKLLEKLSPNERAVIVKKGLKPDNSNIEDKARDIAWRVIKDWIDAQFAFIEADQATVATVFLPYVADTDGNTLASKLLTKDGLKKLGY